jgi:glycosyltransferase involved in cell wall biosynthesis
MKTRRAFVVGAYIPNGGTFMAYHLARILHLDFGFHPIAVGHESSDNGIFDYAPVFPCISVEEMEASISEDDVLIANPSFSGSNFGFRLPGRKVMYIQHFVTFALLDCRFDHYVCVSEFVRNFIANTYGIETIVIPPFIRADSFPAARPWRERPPDSILVYLKGDPTHQQLLLSRLRQLLAPRLPGLTLDHVLDRKLPQRELMVRIGRYRHFLTLSATEGFGLVPLEAMTMGSTVLGFDGFGGRAYMRPGVNCAVTAYPDIEKLADQIVTVIGNPDYAAALAEAGQATGNDHLYTYDHFRAAWREQFSCFLGVAT